MPAPTYDAFTWSDIAATAFPNTGAPTSQNNGSPGASTNYFTLKGGVYVLAAVCAGWNSATATLEKLGPNGSTPLTMATSMVLSANGMTAPTYLSPGQYVLTIGGTPSDGIYADLSRVPVA